MNNWKRRDWIKSALAALGAAGVGRLAARASEEAAASNKFSAEFGPDWQVQKEYTLEVAEAMPAEKYSFKPAEGMRSFAELLVHIGGVIWSFGAVLRGGQPPEASKPPAELTKETVVAYLKAAFDHAAESTAGLDDAKANESVAPFGGRLTMTRAKLCHLMRDHTTHHRGYALPYLRLNGVASPRYRFVPWPTPV